MNLKSIRNFSRPLLVVAAVCMLLLLAIINNLAFGQLPVYSAPTITSTFTFSWIKYALIRYALTICQIMAIIFVIHYSANAYRGIGGTAKLWLISVVTGLILSIIGLCHSSTFGGEKIFDAVFIIGRNAFPLISGMLIFSMLAPYLRRAVGHSGLFIIFMAFLSLPVIFQRDIFFTGKFLSLTGVMILGLAAIITEHISQKHSALLVGGSLLFTVICVGVLGEFSLKYFHNVNILDSWLGLYSPLLILPAIGLSSVLIRVIHTSNSSVYQWFPVIAIFTFLMISSTRFTSVVLSVLLSQGVNVRGGRVTLIFSSIIVLFSAVVLGGIVLAFLKRTVIFKELNNLNNTTLLQAFDIIRKNPKAIVKNILISHWRGIVNFVIIYVLQIVSTLATSTSLKMTNLMAYPNMSIFWHTIFVRWLTMAFASVIILFVYWIILGLTDRYWFSLILTSAIVLILSVASYLKIVARSEPIIPADLDELKSISELLTMVNPVVVGVAILGVLLLVVLMIVLERRTGNYYSPLHVRVLKILVAVVFLTGFKFASHTDSFMSNLYTNFDVARSFSNQLLAAEKNGPFLQFANNVDSVIMAKPEGYSEAAIEKLSEKYTKIAKSINKTRSNSLKKQTIIFNLSESFADPLKAPGIKLNKDPIPYIRNLQNETTSGEMVSFGYGGGTANMEFESLTGLNMGNFDIRMTTPYSQLVERLKTMPNVSQEFNYSTSIHPFVGTFYNRIGVYKKMGINKFVYLNSKYKVIDQKRYGSNQYLSDKTAYANTIKQLRTRKSGQFINLVTIQNHTPHSAGMYPDNSFVATGKDYKTNSLGEVETYARGVNYTDKAVKKFRREIDKIQRPITWVFYGDHFPAYVFSDVMTPKTSLLLHKTEYFIYSNKYAREHGSVSKITSRPYAGTSDFIALALEQANVKVNAYTALLTEVASYLPTPWAKFEDSISSSTEGMRFVRSNGSGIHYSDLTKREKTILHDYQLLQYDITAGEQYSQKIGMKP